MWQRGRRGITTVLIAWLALSLLGDARGDRVRMKNELVYQGTVHHDETIVGITDGVKRTFVRDSKVAKIESEPGLRTLETFQIEQPVEVRSTPASLPSIVLGGKAGAWDDYGQRSYTYNNSKQRPVKLTQAIVEINPKLVKLRGVNGPWQSSLALSQVPKTIITGLLARVDQTDEGERRRVCQFLIQAEWYAEAKTELDRLARDFPDAADGARNAKQSVYSLEAARALAEIDQCLKAQQPRAALTRLKSFPSEGVSPDSLVEVRTRLRQIEDRGAADRKLLETLRQKVASLPEEQGAAWSNRLVGLLQIAVEAPDVARPRLESFARALDDPQATDESRIALAFSGWVVGAQNAVPDLTAADALWNGSEGLRRYLASRPEEDRTSPLAQLQSLSWLSAGDAEPRRLDPALVTTMVRLLPPPRASTGDATPGQPRIVRILDDLNPTPTEYAVLLPPEYHPLRSYPLVVALHNGTKGPLNATAFWGEEAARRGCIVIAPEFVLPGPTIDYRYSASEHAAVTLAIRDARKRFAIDSDRVYLVGQLLGGNMAWDFGLAHPDIFAAMAVVNGLPAKFVSVNRPHGKLLPIYDIIGELAPGQAEVVFPFAKDQITKNHELTHVEYQKRGLEDLPEEVGPVFDWLEKWKRTPAPKTFKCYSARKCDDRFYGIVIKELAPGRTIEPEAIDMMGRNIPKPVSIEVTTSTLANLLNIKTDGLTRFDVWVSPDLVDFQKRMEVRINGKPAFKGLARIELEPLLEDLRIRGDRQQMYWMKVVGR